MNRNPGAGPGGHQLLAPEPLPVETPKKAGGPGFSTFCPVCTTPKRVEAGKTVSICKFDNFWRDVLPMHRLIALLLFLFCSGRPVRPGDRGIHPRNHHGQLRSRHPGRRGPHHQRGGPALNVPIVTDSSGEYVVTNLSLGLLSSQRGGQRLPEAGESARHHHGESAHPRGWRAAGGRSDAGGEMSAPPRR